MADASFADAFGLLGMPPPSSIPVQHPLTRTRTSAVNGNEENLIHSSQGRLVHAALTLTLQARKQAQNVSLTHRMLHGGPRSWHWAWGVCHSLVVLHGHPSWSSQQSLRRERVSIFINGSSASQKNGWQQPLQESRDSACGHQRETELDTSQAPLLQCQTQQSAEPRGKQLLMKPFVLV